MKNTFFTLLITLIFAFTFQNGQAQEFMKLSPKPEGEKQQLVDLERAFNDWAKENDLSQTKGWKAYRRWLDENIRRTNSAGELPDQSVFFKEAIQVAREKQEQVGNRNANWTPVGPNQFPDVPNNALLKGMGRINTVSFHPTDANTFWVGVAQGGVWKTTNGGESYVPLTDDLPILRISDIAVDPTNTDVIYISVGDYAYLGVALDLDERKRNTHYGLGVYKTIDGGQNWAPTGLTFEQTDRDGSLTRRVLIDPDNTQRLTAAGIHGIWRSDDGGDNWSQVYDKMIWDIEQNPVNNQTIYASKANPVSLGGGSAGILKSTDFGDTWEELSTGIPPFEVARIEIGLTAAEPETVYAHCCNLNSGYYGMYRSTDGGATWELRSNSPNILHWFDGINDGGQGWYDMGIVVDPNDADKVYAGGVNLWVSNDGGSTWKIGTYWLPDYGNSVHADQHFYAINPLDEKIYVCNDGGIARTDKIIPTTWDTLYNVANYQWETDWEDISDGMEITSFYRLGVSQSNEDYLVAGSQDNSVMLKKGDQWLNVVLGDGMECFFHPQDENVVYASTQNGRLVRSENGGQNFFYGLTDPIRQSEFGEWTTPFLQHPTEPNSIYAAFQNVWKSPDRGHTWIQLTDLLAQGFSPSSSCLAVSPTDPNVFYVGKRIFPTSNIDGEFWATFDGGNTTIDVTDGLPNHLYFTYCAIDSDDPMTVWVTIGGFEAGSKVFQSTNGGEDWENISLNLPNIPVNCIIQDPNSVVNTLYIGTDLGVYFKNDLMTDWELYSEQLPNVVVTELEVYPNSGKLYASTFGRGIWVSDLAEDPVSTEERIQLNELQISLTPNPNDGHFELNLNNVKMRSLQLEIVDITGRQVHSEKLNLTNAVFSKSFDLDLNYGMYFMRISNGKVSRVVKFLVD